MASPVRIATSVIAALVITAIMASVVVAVVAAATVRHGHSVVAVGGPLMAVVTIEDTARVGGAPARGVTTVVSVTRIMVAAGAGLGCVGQGDESEGDGGECCE